MKLPRPRDIPLWAKGIRPRLILAFIVVALVATVAASGASYVSGRRAVLTAAQDDYMTTLRDNINTIAPTITMPPDQTTLDLVARKLGYDATIVYQGMNSSQSAALSWFPDDLRSEVRAANQLFFQRVDRYGGPYLLVGMPVLAFRPDGTATHSGIEVYAVHSLYTAQQSIEEFADNGWKTAAVAIPLAMLIALLAAGAVLRPVRRLRDAARSLAKGDLSTRLVTTGSDELTDLARTFNDTAASLEASMTELRRMEADARRFVADVSHELRTPLAAMTAVNEILEEETGLTPDAGQAARLVGGETRKLARLVEDLIEISRFDAQTAMLDTHREDVGAMIAGTLRTRGWTESVEADLPAGVFAPVDRRRLDVIVANLVGNALRHGEQPVRVVLRREGADVVVEVTDSGPGLAPDVVPQVFGRFYKADAARARSEGSGLGLSIALKNANLHGGGIEAGNSPDGGARFVLRLPGERSEV
ncbi:MAG: sensor histidine kinase [Amycolatopsis sp.]|nr:sensor histidine kinase [Amycolatopsis sp.]